MAHERVVRALLAASDGHAVRPDELGNSASTVPTLVALASAPLAPLAAQVLAEGLRRDAAGGWDAALADFASGLSAQTSVLALQDAVDVLLGDGAAATAAGAALHDAMLGGLDQGVDQAPHLSAARLETALRVALSGLVRPYLVLDRLANVSSTLPDEYAEALPRLIGIALENWPGDDGLAAPLTSVLEALLETSADADATHELACRRMRLALLSGTAQDAADGLSEARGLFARAQELDEARDDSRAYGAACEAVVAFAHREPESLAAAAGSLSEILARREAWHLGAHQPAWRAGARDAETAWLGLVMDLRHAAQRLGEDSWLDALAAVGQLAVVYGAEHAVAPAPGLAAAVRPAVVSAVAANAVLLGQLTRVLEADRARHERVLPPAAEAILDAAQRRETATGGGTDAGAADRDLAIGRVRRLAPSLLFLGDDACAELGHLSDQALAEAEEVVTPLSARRMPDHPTLSRMKESIVAGMEVNPRFVGEARAAMTALLERTLSFLLDRYERGGPLVPGKKDIIGVIPKGGTAPVEADLQFEFYVWLAAPWEFAGRVNTEKSDISTGRADVTVRFGEVELITEVKREFSDATSAELERKYLAQAAQYSGAGEPFSQLLVLDLTDHSGGVRPLSDLAWTVERQVDPGASPQHVVVAVVVGNRPTPRALKAPPRDAASGTPSGAGPDDRPVKSDPKVSPRRANGAPHGSG